MNKLLLDVWMLAPHSRAKGLEDGVSSSLTCDLWDVTLADDKQNWFFHDWSLSPEVGYWSYTQQWFHSLYVLILLKDRNLYPSVITD